jgi:hypothetical protein
MAGYETGDFSGAYKSQNGIGVKSYTFTFGPTVAARSNETFTPFGHVLLGGFHQVADASGTIAMRAEWFSASSVDR